MALANATFWAMLGWLTPTLLSVAGFSARGDLPWERPREGIFPAAIKTVGIWHPASERAFSTGIFNSGSNVGIIFAAYAVPFIVKRLGWGWQGAFYVTGVLGFVWLTFWVALYNRPERHRACRLRNWRISGAIPPNLPAMILWMGLVML
jgi:ACS family hexuronate transporter-like MFS transporter